MTSPKLQSRARAVTAAMALLWPAFAAAQEAPEAAPSSGAINPQPKTTEPAAPANPTVAPVAAIESSSAKESDDIGKRIDFSLFVDTHYAYTSARSGTPVALHHAFEANAGDFVTHNGFNLSWLGVDASYDGGPIGATASLRFGSAVPVFYGGNASNLGIENLTQAYVTWRPIDRLELDFGQFSTIYGAEVSESWKNLTYTRGALYYLMQPFWHTGLRASYAFSDSWSLTGLAVNGANSVIDDNDTPSLGLQLAYSRGDWFTMTAGYLGALRPSTDGSAFNNFFDLVLNLSLGDFTLLFNGDLNASPNSSIDRNSEGQVIRVVDNPVFWGLSLTAGYQLSSAFGVALRGELLDDAKNRLYGFEHAKDVKLVTVTGTLDFKPLSGSDDLVVRWDNRVESSNRDLFFDKNAANTKGYFESVLGVVVKTDQ